VIDVLYFAWLREKIGLAHEQVPLTAGAATLADVLADLRARHAALDAALEAGTAVRFAVNRRFAQPDAAVASGDEIAIFPPVTGG